MEKIFLIKLSGFPDFYCICKGIRQYSFKPNDELFSYTSCLTVNREPTRKEAELLYELVNEPNGVSRSVCGGAPLETKEIV